MKKEGENMKKEGENMKKEGENMKKEDKIDWNALDEGWKEDYEETYGHFFGVKTVTSEYP